MLHGNTASVRVCVCVLALLRTSINDVAEDSGFAASSFSSAASS